MNLQSCSHRPRMCVIVATLKDIFVSFIMLWECVKQEITVNDSLVTGSNKSWVSRVKNKSLILLQRVSKTHGHQCLMYARYSNKDISVLIFQKLLHAFAFRMTLERECMVEICLSWLFLFSFVQLSGTVTWSSKSVLCNIVLLRSNSSIILSLILTLKNKHVLPFVTPLQTLNISDLEQSCAQKLKKDTHSRAHGRTLKKKLLFLSKAATHSLWLNIILS